MRLKRASLTCNIVLTLRKNLKGQQRLKEYKMVDWTCLLFDTNKLVTVAILERIFNQEFSKSSVKMTEEAEEASYNEIHKRVDYSGHLITKNYGSNDFTVTLTNTYNIHNLTAQADEVVSKLFPFLSKSKNI